MSLTVDDIIQALQPGMEEYSSNSQFFHWMDYACELDELALLNYRDDNDAFVLYINKVMLDYPSGHAKHHACTDVAITLESQLPNKYKGVFKYV